MNDIETRLKTLPRSGPSPELDRRVDRTLREVRPAHTRTVPVWVCAVAAFAGFLAGAVVLAVATNRAGPQGAVVVASAEIQLPASPFIGRSFVQP